VLKYTYFFYGNQDREVPGIKTKACPEYFDKLSTGFVEGTKEKIKMEEGDKE